MPKKDPFQNQKLDTMGILKALNHYNLHSNKKEAKKFLCDKPNNIRGSLYGKIDAYIDMYNYVRGLKNKNTSQAQSCLIASILDTIRTNLKDLGCYNLRIVSSDLL